ncbi:MAG: HAMP domain-containing sensor histidine kinase [Polyangiaceae bacterium]
MDHATLERVLRECRDLAKDDSEFIAACAHRLSEHDAPPRLLRGAIGPQGAYLLGARQLSLITRVAHARGARLPSGDIQIVYRAECAESQLVCFSRQAQLRHLPELWELPQARVSHPACLARGDAVCEYHVRVYSRSRWIAPALGLMLGTTIGLSTRSLANWDAAHMALMALLGGAAGHSLELLRSARANRRVMRAVSEDSLSAAARETEARTELLALAERQASWVDGMDAQLREHREAMSRMTSNLQRLGENRVRTLRGFSHDLRNPLAVLKANLDVLQAPEDPTLLPDMYDAVAQMERLIAELLAVATSEHMEIRLKSERILVPELTERLRRRLSALTHGRNLSVSVTQAREAPDVVDADPVLLDRVLDNLLTNAAKYTAQGTVAVEVGGTPGFLTIKVADTGRGMDSQEIEQALASTPSTRRTADSWGVGLSVVVDLMRRAGGRLEMMSKPGKGTTLWVHLPVDPQSSDRVSRSQQDVVRIRSASGRPSAAV